MFNKLTTKLGLFAIIPLFLGNFSLVDNSSQKESSDLKLNHQLYSNYVSSFSDHPEGGHIFPDYEKLPLIFAYGDNWQQVNSMTFHSDDSVTINTITDREGNIDLTYYRPLLVGHGRFGFRHFQDVKKDWNNFINTKPSYTNYFLIKFGLDYKTRNYIDFSAYAYNRNGDPHYHGNATIVKDLNFPNKIFMRLDQLDSAKIKDVGNGFGSGGHYTGAYWHRFKFFPSTDTVFEVRGIDKLPLKNFWGSSGVFNSDELQSIFQPWRFNQQETKVHINLDIDTQYTWTQPLLYVSDYWNEGKHGNFVDLGWTYDGNDDLLKRRSADKTTIVNSREEFEKFVTENKVPLNDRIYQEILKDYDHILIPTVLKFDYHRIEFSEKIADAWTKWQIENTFLKDNYEISTIKEVKDRRSAFSSTAQWDNFVKKNKVSKNDIIYHGINELIRNKQIIPFILTYQIDFISYFKNGNWTSYKIKDTTDLKIKFLPFHNWKY